MLTATVHGPTHSTAKLCFSRDGNAEASSSRRHHPSTPHTASSASASASASAYSHSYSCEYPLSAISRDAPDELTWAGSTVVWTKGVRAFRKYTCATDEAVSCALFATFCSSDLPASASASQVAGVRSETFGPFHTPTTAKWGAPRVHLAGRERGREREKEDAVVIFLQTRAHVYMSGGSSFIVHLPFVVRAAWAMEEGGVLVRRALTRREVVERRDGPSVLKGMAGGDHTFLSAMQDVDFASEALATVWTLEHPLEVFRPVVRAVLDGRRVVDEEEIGVEMEVVAVLEGPGVVLLRLHETGRVMFAQKQRVAHGEPARRDVSPEELLNGHGHGPGTGGSRPRASLRPLARARERELQDATMMMGLESVEGERSEVVLEVVAEWEVPDSGVFSAFISDDVSPDFIKINLLSATALHTFPTRRLESRWIIDAPHSQAALGAVSIYASRALVRDTLILAPSGLRLRSASHTIPVHVPVPEPERDDVARHFSSSLQMASDEDASMGSRPSGPSLVALRHRWGSEFVAVLETGEEMLCAAKFYPPEGMARQIVDALGCVLSADELWALRVEAMRLEGDWDARVISATQRFIETGTHTQLVASILLALHYVAQDLRLDNTRRAELETLVPLLLDLAALLGRLDWQDYWLRICPGPISARAARPDIDTRGLQRPPDVFKYLSRRLSRPMFSMINLPDEPTEMGSPDPYRQLRRVEKIYNKLGYGKDTVVDRAYAAIRYMLDEKLSTRWIHNLPVGVAVPILEAIRACRLAPVPDWSAEVYSFIDRKDMALQASNIEFEIRHKAEVEEESRTVADVVDGVEQANLAVELPHVRFGSDRRLEEVERIMQTTRVRCIEFRAPKGSSDQDVAAYNQKMTDTIAQRTLAITVGQGIYDLGTRAVDITRTCEIRPIELSVKVFPTNSVLKAQITTDHVDWPCFHNGVAAALAISPASKGIDSSWILSNKPEALNPEHGGFLLGLGLQRHLRDLRNHHAFPYLEARHDFTSIGLLLGLAASYAGSQDESVTKALSVHTHAHLPLGSQELNAPLLVQSAAMVGLGLVHAASRKVQLAKIALAEIGRAQLGTTEHFATHREAYSFACAMSFGLIMLQRGGDAASEVDRVMVGQLRRCIHGDGEALDRNVASPGATLALALMYLKSNRTDIRDVLEIPQSAQTMDSIPPEFLLFRTLARSLIMWDHAVPSVEWIESQMPPFIREKLQGKPLQLVDHFTAMYCVHIAAGACLALGIKYAGTATEAALLAIRHYYDMLGKLAASADRSYEGGIRRAAARQGLNVVTIAMCAVMSGTGEIGVLRRLRIAHGQEGAGVTYGTHMSSHMGLGLLFLGRGQYTLGNSNLAIAAMAIAFFPRFEPTPNENKAYPQMFRHLWALAAEPRCLQARDVDTGTIENVPVKIVLRDGSSTREQKLMSPTLVSPFNDILSVELDTVRYWPVKYDFTNPAHRDALIRARTIHVKRRAAYLDYNADNRGNRSLHARGGSVTGFDMHYDMLSPVAPPAPSADEVRELLALHTNDAVMKGYARVFGGDSPFERFVRTTLLECVAQDKGEMVVPYQQLWRARETARRGGDTGEGYRQAQMLVAYYRVWQQAYAVHPPDQRTIPLVRSTFLGALVNEGTPAGIEPAEEAKRAYLVRGEWAPGVGEWIARTGVPERGMVVVLRERVLEAQRNGWEMERIVRRAVEAVRGAEGVVAAHDARWDRDRDAGETGAEELRVGREGWAVGEVEKAVRVFLVEGGEAGVEV